MYFKLSLRNVRKSFSDYTLYFLTLSIAVCIFYVFNSIEAQKAMMQISDSVVEIMESITKLIGGVSIFISFILGFLIVYANHFLIRRRKREFGIYMTLGMGKGKITRILIMETLIIGVISLAAGLLGGLFLSQGLSVVTAGLFEVDMTSYTFVFSVKAFWKTIIYFAVIFFIAITAGTIAVSRYKLIDLIDAEKRNERPRVKGPLLTGVLFVLSVVMIGIAYAMVIENGIFTFDRRIIIECILGALGTVLFFAALSGFLLRLLKTNKRFYLKGLNLFILRQLDSRINTTYLSMAMISLMLFVTIGIFSTGLGMTEVLNRGYLDGTPFDMTVYSKGNNDIKEILKNKGVSPEPYTEEAIQFKFYADKENSLTLGTIFREVEEYLPAEKKEQIERLMYDRPLDCITVSDYQSAIRLQGKKPQDIPEGEVVLLTQYNWMDADYSALLHAYAENENVIQIGEKTCPVMKKVLTDGLSNMGGGILTLVVPDDLVQEGAASQSVLCFNCKGDSVKQQDLFARELDKTDLGESIYAVSRNDIKAMEGGSKAIISFVAVYVGLVFLITSAAVLALQQLSEAADNRRRYEILGKIGADERLLSKTLFRQIAVYFLLPLAVASVHSFVGIRVANEAIREAGSLDAVSSILITAALVLLVYGAYFAATFLGSRAIMLRK